LIRPARWPDQHALVADQRPEEALAQFKSSGRQGVPARGHREVKLIHHAGASLVIR